MLNTRSMATKFNRGEERETVLPLYGKVPTFTIRVAENSRRDSRLYERTDARCHYKEPGGCTAEKDRRNCGKREPRRSPRIWEWAFISGNAIITEEVPSGSVLGGFLFPSGGKKNGKRLL